MEKKLLRNTIKLTIVKEIKILGFKINLDKKFSFPEPTIDKITEYSELLLGGEHYKAVKLFLNISPKFFVKNNPLGILDGLTQGLFKKEEEKIKTPENPTQALDNHIGFVAIADIIGERYGCLPTEVMQKLTLTQLNKIMEGIEYNENSKSPEGKERNRQLAVKKDIAKNGDKYLDKVNAFRKKRNKQ